MYVDKLHLHVWEQLMKPRMLLKIHVWAKPRREVYTHTHTRKKNVSKSMCGQKWWNNHYKDNWSQSSLTQLQMIPTKWTHLHILLPNRLTSWKRMIKKKKRTCKSTVSQINKTTNKNTQILLCSFTKFFNCAKISIKGPLQCCWWLLVTGSLHSRAWQWSFMARKLIQDSCSSANTVATGTEEQLPYNWINIRLLLQHSALCWGVAHIPPRAPSTCLWICMLRVINMPAVSNVCGAAYMVVKEL